MPNRFMTHMTVIGFHKPPRRGASECCGRFAIERDHRRSDVVVQTDISGRGFSLPRWSGVTSLWLPFTLRLSVLHLAAMPNRFITHVAEGDLGRSFHVAAASHRLQFRLPHPHILLMTSWKPTPRAPAKTKEELREMLAQAVRNTQPETKPLPKAKKGRR